MSDPIAETLLSAFPSIVPEIVLVVCACIVFLGGLFHPNRHVWAGVSLFGIAIAALCLPIAAPTVAGTFSVFASPFVFDSLFWFLRWTALGAGVLFILFSWQEVGDRQSGDYYGCLLIVIAGLSLTGGANDLVTLFLALEMISIPTYVMLYLPKHDKAAQEAALKYFLLSVFSSAILLFGFSYMYGMAGTTNLSVLLHTLHEPNQPNAGETTPLLARVAVIMIVVGLGFKITAAPFHFYAPDVYQGTSTVMAALLAFVPKAAGFAALLRVFGFVLPDPVVHSIAASFDHGEVSPRLGEALSRHIPSLFWFLAAATMFLGNFLALLQTNLRRLFAYSSIAHAGYMMIGLATAPFLQDSASAGGVEALLFYLISYGVMTVGAFAVIALLNSQERPVETVNDLAGLAKTHPWSALLMTVFLFSLIGIPFTAGFTGKLLIFFGAVSVPFTQTSFFVVLAFIGVINAAIGAWYYLRLIATMYLRTAVDPVQRPATIPGLATILVCAVLTIGLSIPPGVSWLLQAAHQAAGNSVNQPVAQR